MEKQRLKPNGEPYKTKWYKPVTHDKRKTNGNNGTRRGKDLKPRKRPELRGPRRKLVYRSEISAGVAVRARMVVEALGGPAKAARLLGFKRHRVARWVEKGAISRAGCKKIQYLHKMGKSPYTASFCRPDLTFDHLGNYAGKRRGFLKFTKIIQVAQKD